MILATTRTLNEEKNIANFCRAYEWADHVIISDGGSSDRTVEIAMSFPNVIIDHYEGRIWKENRWRNPQGAHINHIFSYAKQFDPDWILWDDCDCLPTKAMTDALPELLDDFHLGALMAYRLYVYGTDQYFPDMNKPGQSFYGFNPKLADVVFDESDPVVCVPVSWPEKACSAWMEPPLALLHYGWPSEEEIQRKIEFYKFWKEIDMQHPTQFGGKLEALPDWATPGDGVRKIEHT